MDGADGLIILFRRRHQRHHGQEDTGLGHPQHLDGIGPGSEGRGRAEQGQGKRGIHYVPGQIEAGVKVPDSLCEQQGGKIDGSYQELVHDDDGRGIGGRQRLGEGNLAHLRDDGDKQDADAQPEHRPGLGAGEGDQP